MRRFCVVALLLLAPMVNAQTSDLELTVEVTPPYPWLIGTVGREVFRIKNLGPRSVSFAAMEIRELEPPVNPLLLFENISESCPRLVSCEQFSRLCIGFGSIAAQATKECVFVDKAIRVGSLGAGEYRAFDSSFITTDPNPSNNTVQLTPSVIEPLAQQLPMSPWSYTAMALLTLGVGAIVARRSS